MTRTSLLGPPNSSKSGRGTHTPLLLLLPPPPSLTLTPPPHSPHQVLTTVHPHHAVWLCPLLSLCPGRSPSSCWNKGTPHCHYSTSPSYISTYNFPSSTPLLPPHLHTQSGELQLFEVPSGTLLEGVSAHDGAVWSVCVAPDRRGFVTGSADHTVKFWEFELVSDEEVKSR